MKGSKFFSALFGILGILLMVVTAAVSIASRNAQPRMLESPEAASAQAQRMMDALCAGDYDTAQGNIIGQPDLGAGEPEDAVSRLLWDAFTDSLSYEFTGLCRVTDTGFARDVSVTCLDVSGVTEAVPQRAKALLEAKAAAAEDNSYRSELVDQALNDAVTQALSEDAQTVTRDVTLGLIYQDGAWWVVPDQALLQIISGVA
mgnify:CR=1 FL=1